MVTSTFSRNGASSAPAAAPNVDRTRLSVTSSRATRPDDAPNTVRSTASRERAVTRTSVRLATFATAISSTSPTAPPKSPSVWPALPISAWRRL